MLEVRERSDMTDAGTVRFFRFEATSENALRVLGCGMPEGTGYSSTRSGARQSSVMTRKSWARAAELRLGVVRIEGDQ